MRQFVAIGSDHVSYTTGYVKETLAKHQPDAITLERHLCLYAADFADAIIEGAEFKPMVESMERNGYFYFKVGKHLVSMREDSPELITATKYALEENIPIYFVEWELIIKDRITRWSKGRVDTILINTSCHAYHQGAGITTGRINARNQFAADAINYLFSVHNTIAHIGGRYHFQSDLQLPKEAIEVLGEERLSQDMELQSLVRVEQKYVYDAVLRKQKKAPQVGIS